MYIFVYVFLKGRWHQFSAIFGSILTSFWEAPGSTNKIKTLPERCEKRAPKTELRAGKKVTRDAPPGGKEEGGGALKQFQGHPVHTHHRAQ